MNDKLMELQDEFMDINRYWFLLHTFAKYQVGYRNYIKSKYKEMQSLIIKYNPNLSNKIKGLMIINLKKIDAINS